MKFNYKSIARIDWARTVRAVAVIALSAVAIASIAFWLQSTSQVVYGEQALDDDHSHTHQGSWVSDLFRHHIHFEYLDQAPHFSHMGAEIGDTGVHLPGGYQALMWGAFLWMGDEQHTKAQLLMQGHIGLFLLSIAILAGFVYYQRGIGASLSVIILSVSSIQIMNAVSGLWNVSLLPLPAVLAIVCVFVLTRKNAPAWWVAAGVATSAAMASHMVGFALLAVFGLMGAQRDRKWRSAAFFVMGMVPLMGHYLIVDGLNGFDNSARFAMLAGELMLATHWLFLILGLSVVSIALKASVAYRFSDPHVDRVTRTLMALMAVSLLYSEAVDAIANHRLSAGVDSVIEALEQESDCTDGCISSPEINDIAQKLTARVRGRSQPNELTIPIEKETEALRAQIKGTLNHLIDQGHLSHAWSRGTANNPEHNTLILAVQTPSEDDEYFKAEYQFIHLPQTGFFHQPISHLFASYYTVTDYHGVTPGALISPAMAQSLSSVISILFALALVAIAGTRERHTEQDFYLCLMIVLPILITTMTDVAYDGSENLSVNQYSNDVYPEYYYHALSFIAASAMLSLKVHALALFVLLIGTASSMIVFYAPP